MIDINTTQLQRLQGESIDEVISSLDKIIDWSKANNKQTGYFAALYRKVTVKVKEGIESGYFDDGERMERLDVIFANRYLDAFERYHAGKAVTKVWQLAFEITDEWFHIVLHHLMIGMNAHINLDLGIAAALTVPENEMELLKPDFNKINDVLSDLVDEVEDELGEIWPLFKKLDKLAGSVDERLADTGMAFARDRAWEFAIRYVTAVDKAFAIEEMDNRMHAVAKLFLSPGLIKSSILFFMRLGERGSVAKKISVLE